MPAGNRSPRAARRSRGEHQVGLSAPDPARLATWLERNGATVRTFDVDQLDEVGDWHPERLAVAGGDGSVAPAAAAARRAAPLSR